MTNIYRNEIEDTYKKVNNGEWGWRALRLMSRRSSHFFISGNNPIAKLPDYLDSMLTKMAKEMPNAVAKDDTVESMEEENGDAEENGDGGQEGQENALTVSIPGSRMNIEGHSILNLLWLSP